MRWIGIIALAAWLASGAPAAWGDIGPQNVLVLYNPAWSDGAHDGSYLANYYAGQRGVPSGNLLGITGLGTGEEISATDYLNSICPQVQAALAANPAISVIVTTKGMPLRIRNDMPNPAASSPYEFTYADTAGTARTLYSDTWQPYSSLESELTRVATIGVRNGPNWFNTALLQMGDQTYWNPPDPSDPAYPNPACNPYYQSTAAFSHSNPAYGGMYLASRLDGFTVADVTASIQNAKNAVAKRTSQYVVMDTDPSAGYDRMPELKDVLTAHSQAYVYDNTAAAVTTAPGPVIGYVSHGVHGSGLATGYIPNQLSFSLAPGAVFDTYESFNAYSFQPGGNLDGQGLVAEWLAKGGTAGVGNVQEPMTGSDMVANEDQMFQMLLEGHTWAEAAWSSLQQLSYVNTVVGDPLMTWHPVTGINDLSRVLSNFDKTGMTWDQGDFTGDGRIDINDLSFVLTNYDFHARASAGMSEVPEPRTLMLAASGLVALAAWLARKRR